MTDKLFKVVGTSKFNGQMKVRWATDLVTRFKMLHKGGHTDIELFELPEGMTKEKATEWLADSVHFEKLNEEAQYSVNMKLEEYHLVNRAVSISLEEIAKRPVIETVDTVENKEPTV